MSARNLSEITRDTILTQIQNNIATALAGVRTARGDGAVTTEPPRSYFIYDYAKGYRTPAVFVVVQSIDFHKEKMGANHINATMRIGVSVVIEDRVQDQLTLKAERYQCALHEILDQQNLVSTNNEVKIFILIEGAEFSPIFTKEGPNNPDGVFRKEVYLRLEVQHVENF